MTSQAMAHLVFQCRAAGLPEPQTEVRFHPTRRWRFDAAFPDRKLAVEIEGVVYPRRGTGGHLMGRHVSATGFRQDAVKYGEAFALGWTVLRCLPEQITSGQVLGWLERRLKAAEAVGQ